MTYTSKEILDIFQFRHACKHFDASKKVDDADFQTILEAGRLSPSSLGLEPWRFLVIERQDIKEALYPIAWGARNSLDGADRFVIILARKKIDTLHGSAYITHMFDDIHQFPADIAAQRKEKLTQFQEHDFALTESDRAIFDWASKQTYIALGNMLTVAAMLGVDSCPIEGFDRKAVDDVLAKAGVMDPVHFGVSVMAGFGYRAVQPRSKTRQPAADVIQWVK